MLDHYVYGEVGRVSPEAPVPVLAVDSETHSLGGAGNVLRNLAALGAGVSFVSVVGNDDAGREVQNLAAALDAADIHVLVQPQRKTTVKTRFIAVNQHLLRTDRESSAPMSATICCASRTSWRPATTSSSSPTTPRACSPMALPSRSSRRRARRARGSLSSPRGATTSAIAAPTC